MVDRAASKIERDQNPSSMKSPVQSLASGESTEVEQSSWGAYRSEDAVISTGGLGPCCGVIVFDTQTKTATVGHFVCLSVEGGLVDEMFDFLRATRTQGSNFQAAVGGLAPMGDIRSSAEAAHLREQIIERLESVGIPRAAIETTWAEDDTTVSLEIHTATGRIESASYDIFGDEDLFI